METEKSKEIGVESQLSVGTIVAYNKVCIEKIGLDLEISKLENFLKEPKYVSERMIEAMGMQLESMIHYSKNLSERIKLFLIENPELVGNNLLTKGEELIGNFNPNDNPKVAEIKNRATQLINCIDAFGLEPRRKSIAFTEIEKGQMFAVKSLFH